jgi:hypothetical protein
LDGVSRAVLIWQGITLAATGGNSLDNSVKLYRCLILLSFAIVLAMVFTAIESGAEDWTPITLFAVFMMASGVVLCVYAAKTAPGQQPQ